MTTYYKAVFSNGRIELRSTAGRTYSHAYLAAGEYRGSTTNGAFHRSGWSRTESLAHKALRSCYPHGERYVPSIEEVAPAVEITSAEYRSLRKTEGSHQ